MLSLNKQTCALSVTTKTKHILKQFCAISLTVFAVSSFAASNQKLTTAASQTQISPLNLTRAYELALKNDAIIATAKASYNATSQLTSQGRAYLLPQISLGSSYSSTNVKRENTNIGTTDNSGHSWNATLSQPLFNLEAWFGYSQATQLTAQAKALLSLEQQNLILRVATAYFDVLRADDALETAKAQERALKRQLEQTKQRFEVGLTAETDVFEATAVYDDARVLKIDASNQVELALEAMSIIINTNVKALAKLDKQMPVQAPIPSVIEDWVNSAMAQNYSLKAANFTVDAAHNNLKAVRSKYAPTINASASYVSGEEEAQNSNNMINTDTTVYSIDLNMPIFTGGLTTAQVKEAAYKLEEAQSTKETTLRTVKANARNLYRTVSTDVDRVAARCRGIISAQSALQATESGYQVGTRNIVDLLDAQNSYYAAQSNYLNARYDYIINTLQLKLEAGTLSPEDLVDLNNWLTLDPNNARIPACLNK